VGSTADSTDTSPRQGGQGVRQPEAEASGVPESPARSLWRRYLETRATTLGLAAPLTPEDCALQSMPDASPVKWHLAHTSWFFETFLLLGRVPAYRAFDERFRTLFNSYYVQVGPRHARAERGLVSRPDLAAVQAYRAHVDRGVEAWFERGPDRAQLELLELGIHHEQQHQELILTDLKHLFSRNPLRPAYANPAPRQDSVEVPLRWVPHAGGVRAIGHAGDGFCFDNERPAHRVYVEPFRLGSRLVTNAEYLAFMDDGGYARPELWMSDGWDVRLREAWEAPLYWERDASSGWQRFSLAGMVPLEAHAPVCHVSWYEADAFARWRGARLPTEAEWEDAASRVPVTGNFAESRLFDPRSAPDGSPGLAQCFGDVWEWTASAYRPYPGYRPALGAVGEYNGKFMVNQFVLRGGSCASPASHLRPSYRNFFPPQARWQFTGIRLCADA